MTVDPAVLKQVSDELQLYVYMLVDPRNGIPFYVGKGQGIRAHAHLAEAMIEIDEDDEVRVHSGGSGNNRPVDDISTISFAQRRSAYSLSVLETTDKCTTGAGKGTRNYTSASFY